MFPKVLEYDVSISLSFVESQSSSLRRFGGDFSTFIVEFQSQRLLFESETTERENTIQIIIFNLNFPKNKS